MYRRYKRAKRPITNRDPGPDGVVGTSGGPGKVAASNFWDYPASLRGQLFEDPDMVTSPTTSTR